MPTYASWHNPDNIRANKTSENQENSNGLLNCIEVNGCLIGFGILAVYCVATFDFTCLPFAITPYYLAFDAGFRYEDGIGLSEQAVDFLIGTYRKSINAMRRLVC